MTSSCRSAPPMRKRVGIPRMPRKPPTRPRRPHRIFSRGLAVRTTSAASPAPGVVTAPGPRNAMPQFAHTPDPSSNRFVSVLPQWGHGSGSGVAMDARDSSVRIWTFAAAVRTTRLSGAVRSTSRMEPIVRAAKVHKTYDSGSVEVHALRGVDLEIAPGEMVAIMGPSGCGKTTLLNCLSGLDDLSGGDVWVEGVNLSEMGDDRRTEYRARRMGFIFQSYNLLPILNARENVELPLILGGVSYRQAREVARRILDLVGLADFGEHRPAELSAGQQQRVAIARALVNKPAIVWADEPTGNLDSETSAQVMDLLVRLNRENGQTFVVVTHDPAVAARGHRILQMKNGQIVKESRAG